MDSRDLNRRRCAGLGWLLGCIPALSEALRVVFSGYDTGVPIAVLISLGTYPILGMMSGLLVAIFSFARRWNRAVVFFSLFLLFPWIVGIIFPVISLRSLLMEANMPKVAAVLILCVLIARELGRHHAWLLRIVPRSIPVMLAPLVPLGIAGLLVLPRGDAIPVRQSHRDDDRPNFILISIDTLRKDELALWGGDPSTAPTLDSLSRAGTVFTDCYSTAPWTLASIASFMTGEYPSTIQVLTGEHYLSGNATTLSERLREHGYYTHAVVSNIWLREQFGIAQGFDTYDHRRPPDERSAVHTLLPVRIYKRLIPGNTPVHKPESASDLGSRVTAFLQSNPTQPFFLWIHFNDVHDPYAPPFEYLPRDGARSSVFTYTSGRIVSLRMGRRLKMADRRRLRSLYRGEITYVDAQIRDILHVLRSEDLATGTIVATTSDHGEEFWDHGSVGHGHTVYNELVGVPLIFSCQTMIPAGIISEEPASLIDMVPTILSVLGCGGSEKLPGMNLFSSGLPGRRPRYVEGLEFFTEQKAVISDSWKLALVPALDRSSLFDLDADSGEAMDVSSVHEEKTAELVALLDGHQIRCRIRSDSLDLLAARPRMELTPRLREMLRAQGYIE